MVEFHGANLLVFGDESKENLHAVDAEDAAVANLAALAGGRQLDVAPTAVEIVSQRDTERERENL